MNVAVIHTLLFKCDSKTRAQCIIWCIVCIYPPYNHIPVQRTFIRTSVIISGLFVCGESEQANVWMSNINTFMFWESSQNKYAQKRYTEWIMLHCCSYFCWAGWCAHCVGYPFERVLLLRQSPHTKIMKSSIWEHFRPSNLMMASSFSWFSVNRILITLRMGVWGRFSHSIEI